MRDILTSDERMRVHFFTSASETVENVCKEHIQVVLRAVRSSMNFLQTIPLHVPRAVLAAKFETFAPYLLEAEFEHMTGVCSKLNQAHTPTPNPPTS